MRLYSYKAVERFISDKLIPLGYEVHTVPGSLVDGYVCVAPDNVKYHFLAQERHINAWSSGLSMRRCRKLPGWAVDLVQAQGRADA